MSNVFGKTIFLAQGEGGRGGGVFYTLSEVLNGDGILYFIRGFQ